MVMTAPTALASIGPAFDLCYEVTGAAPDAKIAFDVSLVLVATGSVQSQLRVDAAVGRGSVRVNLGTPEPRRYDMPVQAVVNRPARQRTCRHHSGSRLRLDPAGRLPVTHP
jgi:hypothetical protein